MDKARAAATAIVGLALTATGALAAAPTTQTPTTSNAVSTLARDKTAVGGVNDNHGGAVSALARTTADDAITDAAAPDTTGSTDAAQGAHGTAVTVVAQDSAAVGGANDNHGGAVSAVARGTHGPDATHGQSAGKSQAPTHPGTH